MRKDLKPKFYLVKNVLKSSRPIRDISKNFALEILCLALQITTTKVTTSESLFQSHW